MLNSSIDNNVKPKKRVYRKKKNNNISDKKENESIKEKDDLTTQLIEDIVTNTEESTPQPKEELVTDAEESTPIQKEELVIDAEESTPQPKEELVTDAEESTVQNKEELVTDAEESTSQPKEELVTDAEESAPIQKEELVADNKEVKQSKKKSSKSTEKKSNIKKKNIKKEELNEEKPKKVARKNKNNKDTKEEVKEELKEELKEEVKEEVKEELKPELKVETKEIIEEKNLEEIEENINSYVLNNNYIKDLIQENIKDNLFEKKEEENNINFENKLNDIINNLKKNNINDYTVQDIQKTFSELNTGSIFVQIIDNKLYYLEKKSTKNRNNHILNILHNLVNDSYINNTSFIIDTNDESIINKDYVLRFNKIKDNENLIIPNYNLDYNLENNNLEWENKNEKILLCKNYVNDETYDKLKEILDTNYYDIVDEIYIDKIKEYRYVIYQESIKTINQEIDILRSNVIMIKLKFKDIDDLETYYSSYYDENIHYYLVNYDNLDDLKDMNKNFNILESKDMLKSLNEKNEYIFSTNLINKYLKNLLSRLSLKCKTEQIINKKIFTTNRTDKYIFNRLEHKDNIFDFNFQGKDFEIMIKNKEGNKLNILINQSVTNIFYESNSIFNYRIPNIVSNILSSNYTFIIRNKDLYLFRNKNNLILRCKIPIIYNIDKIAIRTFNQDSWWIC